TPRAHFGGFQNLRDIRSRAQKLNAGSDGYGGDRGAGFQGGAGLIEWQTTDLSQQSGNRASLGGIFYGAEAFADFAFERFLRNVWRAGHRARVVLLFFHARVL